METLTLIYRGLDLFESPILIECLLKIAVLPKHYVSIMNDGNLSSFIILSDNEVSSRVETAFTNQENPVEKVLSRVLKLGINLTIEFKKDEWTY